MKPESSRSRDRHKTINVHMYTDKVFAAIVSLVHTDRANISSYEDLNHRLHGHGQWHKAWTVSATDNYSCVAVGM